MGDGAFRFDMSVFDSPAKLYPLPRVVFRLFDPSDCPDEVALPPADSIERFLVEEDLNWIIDNNYLNFKVAAEQIVHYHRSERVPINYCVVEVILGQLFRLPHSPHLELFYGAVLYELCRTRAETMPQVVAIAAEYLYRRADTMQPTCIDRFANWFSYHLSNFNYLWSWADWADCLKVCCLFWCH
jgi:nuclear cap-binding protein subunit 1